MNKELSIVEMALASSEFTRMEDGFVYYFPSTTGGLDAHHLREIADYLDRENKRWKEDVDRYFAGFSAEKI